MATAIASTAGLAGCKGRSSRLNLSPSSPRLYVHRTTRALPARQGVAKRGAAVTTTAAVSDWQHGATSAAAQALDHIAPVHPQMVASLGSTVETGVVALYLGGVLVFLGAGSFFVVRQVLIRRELENAAKDLQERVRLGEATPDEYFELGAIMLRKKFYSQALKNLMMAEEIWDGDPEELAQVHNATGFTLLQMEKFSEAEERFRMAVGLQPGYVTAWNNLGNSFETRRMWREALEAYEESLSYDPNNTVALERKQMVSDKLDMYKY